MRRSDPMRRWACLLVFVVGASASGAGADDTKRLIKIYMEEATRETKVPSKLAARLAAEAEKVTDNPPLRVELYRKAYEYGMRTPAGHESAMKAAEALLEISPSAKPAWADKLVKLHQLTHARKGGDDKKAFAAKMVAVLVRAGDACLDVGASVEAGKFYRRAAFLARNMHADLRKTIHERIQEIQASKRTKAKIEGLKKRVKHNPKDAETRMELIRCCVVDGDRPADAASHLDASVPAVWRTNVSRAAKDPSALDGSACFELGTWYVTLGKSTAVPGARRRMFRRAGTYLRRFLDQHTRDDASSATAEKLLRSMGKEPYVWTDLLKIPPSSSSSSCLTIPLLIEGSYELWLRFARRSRSGSIYIYFPLGRREGHFMLRDSGSQLYGLTLVDNKGRRTWASTTWYPSLKTGVVQTLKIKVVPGTNGVAVSARLDDDRPWHSWQGRASSKSGATLRVPRSSANVRLLSAKLRMLSGRMWRLAPAGGLPTKKKRTRP